MKYPIGNGPVLCRSLTASCSYTSNNHRRYNCLLTYRFMSRIIIYNTTHIYLAFLLLCAKYQGAVHGVTCVASA